MDGIFYTLQDFMTYTKGTAYLLIIAALLGILAFWRFLTERETPSVRDDEPHGHH
jgi:hypothetical protein